jgi:hypothetical protein
MLTLARYSFPVSPSPSTCEATQRELDAIDPRILLHVEGTYAEVQCPEIDHRVHGPFFRFIKAVRQQAVRA